MAPLRESAVWSAAQPGFCVVPLSTDSGASLPPRYCVVQALDRAVVLQLLRAPR